MIKKLSRSIRDYWKQTILAPCCVAVDVVVDTLIPLQMATLIDKGIDAGDMGAVIRTGAILLLLALCGIISGCSGGILAAAASAGFAGNLRRDLYYRVQDFSFANIDRFSTAGIVTRLTTDVSNVQMAYLMIIRMVVRAPLMIVFSLVASIRINAGLSLIFLACLPILGVGLYFIMTRAHPYFERTFNTYDDLNNSVQENLHGIRVVKSFIREKFECEKFGRFSGAIYNDYSKAEKLVNLNLPLMQFCMYGCMLLISWFGARAIVTSGGSALTTGELMSLITFAMQILMSLMILSMVIAMLTIARASAERIVQIIDEKNDLTEPDEPVYDIPDGSIRFENVSFSYSGDDSRLCLKNIDLDIASGMTVGILGTTGSAKSSLVQLIPRLYDATQGRVLVGGRDVREYDIKSLRDCVAMVLQKNVLFSGSVKDNLRWGDENASDGELERVCRLAQADGFIRELPQGYDTRLEQGGTNVSGGQKQRLCIARALLKKPKILILDDSTSAVDTRTDAEIRRAFREEIPDTTKLIISQRVASVQDADLIVIIDEGCILAAGSHEELMQNSGVYREVCDAQMNGGDFDEQ